MAENEKRDNDRIPVKIPVRCVPVGSDFKAGQSLEIWTSDVHPHGTGLNWPLSSKPQTCPVCQNVVKDPNCLKSQCPYRAMRDALFDSGWLELRGLNYIPGWENEEKVLGKVMWFKIDDEGVNFQFGVQFSREKPPIQTLGEAEGDKAVRFNLLSHEIHELDIERWKEILRVGLKQVLIIDEDRIECKRLLEFLGNMGYAGKTVSSDLVGMAEHFVENPRIIVFNPLFGGKLKMELFEKLHETHPDARLALIVDPAFKADVFDSPQFHLATWIFVKPLDFDRIRETLHKI